MKAGKNSRSIKKVDESLKREMALKNTLFSRYLMLRYSIAFFYFSNLYWLLALGKRLTIYVVLPSMLLIILVLASIEQFRLYGAKTVKLSHTEQAMKFQACVNLFLIILPLVPNQLSKVIPYFSNDSTSYLVLILFQVLGLLISLGNLRRIKKIKMNKDKFYYYFRKHIEKYI